MYISINFAHNGFYEAQKICSESAIKKGDFDKAISYTIKDLDEEFLKLPHFKHRRGFGFWVWKPYLIYKTLLDSKPGDIVAYIDSGCSWASSIKPYVEYMTGDILAFRQINTTEREHTKKELLLYMNMDKPEILDSKQMVGGYNIWKVSEASKNFAKEWLDISSKMYLIDDMTALYNYRGYKDHRHDQSIFGLLCKKYNIQSIDDPSEYGPNSDPKLPRLINCTRLQS